MKFSLKKKTILMVISIAILMMLVCFICTFQGITGIIQTQYRLKSEDLCSTVGETIDVERFERVENATLGIFKGMSTHVSNAEAEEVGEEAFLDYLASFSQIMEMEEYHFLQEWLRKISEVNHVEYICACTADLEREAFIYLVDTSSEDDEEFCPPGSFDYFTESDKESMKNPEQGFQAEITRTQKYGWLLGLAQPIIREGRILGYIEVGVSMNDIIGMRNFYLFILSAFMLVLVVLIGVVGIALVNLFIIKPVNILSKASQQYCGEGEESSHQVFSKLDIHTGDEIEALTQSMVRMEKDINEHIERLVNTTNELISAREREHELDQLANVDGLTLVYNKRAYSQEVLRLNEEIGRGTARFGIAIADLNNLKHLNDDYGHERGDIAIQTLCALVKDIFRHSRIFRFGGDEFVVLIEGLDWEKAKELYQQFLLEQERRIGDSSLSLWEKGLAAIGYSLYQPGVDTCVDQVFDRADAAMYENKKKSKYRLRLENRACRCPVEKSDAPEAVLQGA